MTENETSTIRLYKTTIKRLRKHKPTPGTSDDWVINYILDEIEKGDCIHCLEKGELMKIKEVLGE